MVAGLLAAVIMVSASARTTGENQFDADATYKAKCVACHGQKAEKKFRIEFAGRAVNRRGDQRQEQG